MLLIKSLAALGFIASVNGQFRTTTIFKKLSPTAAPLAPPTAGLVGFAGMAGVAPQAVPGDFGSWTGAAGPDSLVGSNSWTGVAAPAGQGGFKSWTGAAVPASPGGFGSLAGAALPASLGSSGTLVGVSSGQRPRAGNAVPITNNPQSIVYRAVLRGQNGLNGYITAQAGPGGMGVRYKLEANGLFGYGPFSYYLYERSVPASGDCYAIGGRLDPYLRGEAPKCTLSAPETCQVGDLSGKYGRLDPVPNARKLFVDRFSSLQSSDASFVGGRSVAIVDNTGIRLACATFFEAEDLDYEDFE